MLEFLSSFFLCDTLVISPLVFTWPSLSLFYWSRIWILSQSSSPQLSPHLNLAHNTHPTSRFPSPQSTLIIVSCLVRLKHSSSIPLRGQLIFFSQSSPPLLVSSPLLFSLLNLPLCQALHVPMLVVLYSSLFIQLFSNSFVSSVPALILAIQILSHNSLRLKASAPARRS